MKEKENIEMFISILIDKGIIKNKNDKKLKELLPAFEEYLYQTYKLLGMQVKDKISGVSGIATARCEYITGCETYKVETRSEDGIYVWVDKGRLKIINNNLVDFRIKEEDVNTHHPNFKK